MGRPRAVSGVVVFVVVVAAIVATVPTVAGAVPDADCAGSGSGAIFVADSGFTVEYNDTQPMPSTGPFQGDETLRFRNVTLSSSGDAFLRLEDGTGPETCLAAVDASLTAVRIDPDDEQAIIIDGMVDVLSLADADYGSGSVDFAYEAGSSWTLTVPSTGLGGGTEIVAEARDQTVLATGTVDSTGELVLALPAGTHDVDLREPTPQISVTAATAATTEVRIGEPVDVTADLRNDGDASGEYTATLTADGQTVASETVTVPASAAETVTLTTSFTQAGVYNLSVGGQDAGAVTVTNPTAKISVAAVSAQTSAVRVSEGVDVAVELRNDGDASGEFTATLTADGQAVANETVTMGANTAETATLTTSFSQAGTYNLSVDGQDAGTVTVSEPTPQISVASVSTQVSAVRTAESVDVNVELQNDGDASGEYTATLTADGQVVVDKTVTVGANTTETTTLRTSFSQAGAYSLSVDGQYVGEVTITEAQQSDTTDVGDTEQDGSGDSDGEQDSSSDGGALWLLILALVALLAGVGGYAVARRSGGGGGSG